MNVIDLYSITSSQEQALTPGSTLIDGRTELERLSFLADFASLINFYDNNNRLHGDWQPFLLKDPVLLLAHIASTRFEHLYTPYLYTCQGLENMLSSSPSEIVTVKKNTATEFNQLFDQLTTVFLRIRQWIYFMQHTTDEYTLKNYVIHHVKTNFSSYFWAILSLRQNLFLSSVIEGIKPVDHTRFHFKGVYDEITWKQEKDRNPYWEVLDLKSSLKDNSELDILNALKKAGDAVFNFLHTIVQHAPAAFEEQQIRKSKFPDTTLLRTFVNLLSVQQEQLNGIAEKHLDFYYGDILKQAPLQEKPDHVVVAATLAKKDQTFSLSAGTLFDAGLDAQKMPILFSNPTAATLNPASIVNAYALASVQNNNTLVRYLQHLPDPGTLQKDTAGNIIGSQTFGGAGTISVPMGIAIASPALLLREGVRNITLKMTFADKADAIFWNNGVNYYLSTQKMWLQVYLAGQGTQRVPVIAGNEVTLQFSLDASQPAIEPMLKNPDGFSSSWPMFKISFASANSFSTPPVLQAISITANVAGLKTLKLYNDYGALNARNPFALWGATPMPGSNFIVGSDEMFGKNLQSFTVEMDWDNLPSPDFSSYYLEYNNYTANPLPVNPPPQTTSSSSSSILGTIIKTIAGWFTKKTVSATAAVKAAPAATGPINNTYFTVGFSLLQNGNWNPLLITKECSTTDATTGNTVYTPYNNQAPQPENILFIGAVGSAPSSDSCFAYNAVTGNTLPGNASLQSNLLSYSSTSKNGFIKIQLTGGTEGFGSALYPAVVAGATLNNAVVISNKMDASNIIKTPQPPYIPKLEGLTVSYTATQDYNLISGSDSYPLQCFLYGAFQNNLVYDNSDIATVTTTQLLPDGGIIPANGLPLFPSSNSEGFLFLEMENLLPANEMNLYFELTRNYNATTTSSPVGYYYLGNKGWTPLSLLADSTNGLTCSGIVTVKIPADISNNSSIMSGNNYWLCVTAEKDPASFARLLLLSTNGIALQRVGNTYLSDTMAPRLLAGLITKPQTAIPQILSISQPFPSSGGRAAENRLGMRRRVSNRLKNKDRAVSVGDFFTLIRQQYSDIYYVKPVLKAKDKCIGVYVIPAIENSLQPNALTPLVSQCREEHIRQFLLHRTAGFYDIVVSGFDFQPVLIAADLSIKAGLEANGMQTQINKALQVFLSPWITGNDAQVNIGQEISDTQVAAFIKTIPGVEQVNSISLFTWKYKTAGNHLPDGLQATSAIKPIDENCLMVSVPAHKIQCSTVA